MGEAREARFLHVDHDLHRGDSRDQVPAPAQRFQRAARIGGVQQSLPSALQLRVQSIGESAAKLYTPDWSVINEKREEWTKRWNREVER